MNFKYDCDYNNHSDETKSYGGQKYSRYGKVVIRQGNVLFAHAGTGLLPGTQEIFFYNHRITQRIADRLSNGLLYPDIIHRFSKNYRDQKPSLDIVHGTSMKVSK